MLTTLAKAPEAKASHRDISALRDSLIEEKLRLDRILREAEDILRNASTRLPESTGRVPRSSPLDPLKQVAATTQDLRVANGNLSADRVAKLFGLSQSQLAKWLGRTKQAVSKTPDADSLQSALGFFERVARLRVVIESDGEFRKWLRMPNDALAGQTPFALLEAGHWQRMADFVDDALTGAPT